MAAAPVYFTVAKIGHGRITTGVANTDGSGTSIATTWYNTAPTADWMLTKVIFSSSSATGVGDLADCLIHVFVSDGSTERLVRTIDMGNYVAGTVALPGAQFEVNFGPEWVFPSTVLPKFNVSVTPTAGNLDFVVFAQSSQ